MTFSNDIIEIGIEAITGQVIDFSETTRLDIIRAVDHSVDQAVRVQKAISHSLKLYMVLSESLTKTPPKRAIDFKGYIDAELVSAENATRSLHEVLSVIRDGFDKDNNLSPDDKESIVSEYNEAIKLNGQMFEAIEQLRMVVSEHDADMSDDIGTFTSPDELITALND